MYHLETQKTSRESSPKWKRRLAYRVGPSAGPEVREEKYGS